MTGALLTVSLAPMVGREHSWTLTDDDGRRVADGLVPVDLAAWWDEQADRALPAHWERYGAWDVRGDKAVAPVRLPRRAAAKRVDTAYPKLRASLRQDSTDALVSLFERMQPDVADRYDAGAKVLIAKRWISELQGVVLDRHTAVAAAIGGKVADALAYPDFDPAVMDAWLELNAGFIAEGVTANAEQQIRDHDDSESDESSVSHVFGILADTGAAALATQMTTTVGNFAVRDTAVKSGAAVKVWHVNSGNPRASHAAMNGESVGMDERFSNGLMWPGDPDGDADEVAECMCSLSIVT